uniref:C-type lectin domain-containing protein n=1 Tax=Parastrongyloides trichosuri TaxID=131310 RepID=A0A0N4ZKF7_PARTI
MIYCFKLILIFNSIILLANTSRLISICPKGWDWDKISQSCYIMINKRLTFDDAKNFCLKKYNAQLLSINNKQQNDLIRDYYAFFGSKWLSASLEESILKWNGRYPITFTNFDPFNSLSNASSKLGCLKMLENGLWVNTDCSMPTQFVCQKNLIDPIKESFSCPKSWSLFKLSNSCFKVIKVTSLSNAEKACKREAMVYGEEASLASINSKEENEFILELSLKHSPHLHKILLGGIGGRREKFSWVWLDGNDFDKYQNWDKYMPRQNNNMTNLVMLKSGKWANIKGNRNSHPHHTVAACKLIFLM